MIAKFARYRAIGAARQMSPATAARGNDNRALRRVRTDPQRTLRRVLVCHWTVRPQTGALECVWDTQAAKLPTHAVVDEDPKIGWSSGRARGVRKGFISDATARAAAG